MALEVAGFVGCGGAGRVGGVEAVGVCMVGQASGDGAESARGMWLGRRMSASMRVWTADSCSGVEIEMPMWFNRECFVCGVGCWSVVCLC